MSPFVLQITKQRRSSFSNSMPFDLYDSHSEASYEWQRKSTWRHFRFPAVRLCEIAWMWFNGTLACTDTNNQSLSRNSTPETVCACVSGDTTAPPQCIVLSDMALLCVCRTESSVFTPIMHTLKQPPWEQREWECVCACVSRFHLSTIREIYVMVVDGVNKDKYAHSTHTHLAHLTSLSSASKRHTNTL